MSDRERRVFIVVALAFAVLALLPMADTGVWLSLGVELAMYTVLATSWTLFSGPTHYISLATAALFGLGMYVIGGGIDLLPFPLLVGFIYAFELPVDVFAKLRHLNSDNRDI